MRKALAGERQEPYVLRVPEPSEPNAIPPFIDWMSRHGIKVLLALVVIELAFHAMTVFESRQRGSDDSGGTLRRRPAAARALPS